MHKKIQILFISFFSLTFLQSLLSSRQPQATDKTEITSLPVHAIIKPQSVEALTSLVVESSKPLSIGGSFYSQGGQTAYTEGMVIDMSLLNDIVDFDVANKRITVQAGATWRTVQEAIDPYNLSVKVMQSYNDFSVGGSIAVNVHARDRNYGSLISTIESFRLMIHDGSILDVDKSSALFSAVIGGYGLLGIVVDATFTLTDNCKLERSIKEVAAHEYPYLYKTLKRDSSVVFQNADVFPPHFDKAHSITWRKTRAPLTSTNRLQSTDVAFSPHRTFEKVLQRVPVLRKVRPTVETVKSFKSSVVWRNYEMSYNVNQLAIQSHYPTTMTLQEYFVPTDKYHEALNALRKVVKKYSVNVLNLSVRYVPKDTESILSYSPQDSYAFVLYICISNSNDGKNGLSRWTQVLIDKIIGLGGTYYLPYVMCATEKQFKQAYPRYKELVELKAQYDPQNKFRNMLWKTYFERG